MKYDNETVDIHINHRLPRILRIEFLVLPGRIYFGHKYKHFKLTIFNVIIAGILEMRKEQGFIKFWFNIKQNIFKLKRKNLLHLSPEYCKYAEYIYETIESFKSIGYPKNYISFTKECDKYYTFIYKY